MKKIFGLLLTICSVSVFAQMNDGDLLERIHKSGVLCNLEDFMVEHSLSLVKKEPTSEIYIRQLRSAQSEFVECMSKADAAVHSDCESSIARLLDKGLVCTSESAMVEATYEIYKVFPTSANKKKLREAQKASVKCVAKTDRLCKN